MPSFPLMIHNVQATEAVLDRVYEAAWNGARGDEIAAALRVSPDVYHRLRALDPLVEQAEIKGRADAKLMLSKTLMTAAAAGDTKVALEILKHQHDWVAKQQVQVDVTQQISIHAALEKAQARVLKLVEEIPSAAAPLLSGTRDGTDGEALEPRHQGRPREVRTSGVPLG